MSRAVNRTMPKRKSGPKKTIHHIIAHDIDPIYPRARDDPKTLLNLDHAVTKYISYLMRYTDEFDHHLILVSKSVTKQLNLTHTDGYPLTVLPTHHPFLNIECSPELIRYLNSLEKDEILHFHGISSFLYETTVPFIRNKNIITHYRGGHFTWKALPISLPKYGLFLPLVLHKSKMIFVENKTRLKHYRQRYLLQKKRLRYIPAMIDTKAIRPKQSYSNKNIVYAGRLRESKGIKELLQGFNAITDDFSKATLTIAGDGPLRKDVEEAQRHNPNIRYTGELSYKELLKLYRQSDLFILPTHYDSFGLVILEAMATGLPIITTKTEGPRDQVTPQQNGLFIKKGSAEDISVALTLLLTHPEKIKSYGKKSRKKAETFDYRKISEKIRDMYNQLLR